MIQPLLHATEVESYWLGRGSVSWRFFNRSLEYLAPVRVRIFIRAQPLLDQFLRYFPEVAGAIQEHDRRLEAVHRAAAAAFDGLVADPEFVHGVQACHDEFLRSAPQQGDWQGAHASEDRPRLAAEYVVNNVGPEDLPDSYTSQAFWRTQGTRLLGWRESERHRAAFVRLARVREALAVAARDLHSALRTTRDGMADTFGLPAAVL